MSKKLASRKDGGFSIVETLVALSLLGFLLAGSYALMLLGFRHAREAEVFETVHQQALVGMEKMSRELALSSISSVNGIGTGYLIFASPQKVLSEPDHHLYTFDGNHNLEWQKWVCYHRNANDNLLVRTEQALSSGPSNAPPTTPPPLTDLTQISGPQRQSIARNCSNLLVEAGAATLGSVRLTLEVSARVDSERQTRMQIVAEVQPRNEP